MLHIAYSIHYIRHRTLKARSGVCKADPVCWSAGLLVCGLLVTILRMFPLGDRNPLYCMIPHDRFVRCVTFYPSFLRPLFRTLFFIHLSSNRPPIEPNWLPKPPKKPPKMSPKLALRHHCEKRPQNLLKTGSQHLSTETAHMRFYRPCRGF